MSIEISTGTSVDDLPRSRSLILRSAEIKYITKEDDIIPVSEASRTGRTWVHLVIEGHPQYDEISTLVSDMLAPEYDPKDSPNDLKVTHWSTPIRDSQSPAKRIQSGFDTRRQLRTNVHKGRCPLLLPDGSVQNVFDVVWPGQLVDVQLSFYRANVSHPRLVSSSWGSKPKPETFAMVYANALGFKLIGGTPRGLEGL